MVICAKMVGAPCWWYFLDDKRIASVVITREGWELMMEGLNDVVKIRSQQEAEKMITGEFGPITSRTEKRFS